mgnify:CR=1 FL=1
MIACRDVSELEKLRAAGRVVAEVLGAIRKRIAPGLMTLELEHLAEQLIPTFGGAKPAFKGYHGYPCALCTSVNEEIVHGIPSRRKLQRGDIISVDVGVELNGYFADGAITAALPPVAPEVEKLLRVTEEALYKGIEKACVDNLLSDISAAIEQHVKENGFSVVREFVGHGIGTQLHEEPQVPNYFTTTRGPRLKAGMVLAIEPMVTTGSPAVKICPDRWTAVTADGGYAAHFEHCVAVTENGPWILTQV